VVPGYVGGEARPATSPLKELAAVRPPRMLYDEVLVTGRTAGRVGFRHNLLLCTSGLMIRSDFTDVFATRLDPSHPRPAADKRTSFSVRGTACSVAVVKLLDQNGPFRG
jgi:hypothetical protein